MIAIPNIDKPKSCFNCFAYDGEFMECRATGECVNETFYDKVRDDCPLIEIDLVRCKECKFQDECILGSYGVSEHGFCYKGERRADETNT